MALSVLDDKIVTRILASIIAFGFLAWSAAVWRATSSVDTLATSVNIRLTNIEEQHRDIETALQEHLRAPTHAGTAVELAKLQADDAAAKHNRESDFAPLQRQLDIMQKQLDRIEARAEALANQKRN